MIAWVNRWLVRLFGRMGVWTLVVVAVYSLKLLAVVIVPVGSCFVVYERSRLRRRGMKLTKVVDVVLILATIAMLGMVYNTAFGAEQPRYNNRALIEAQQRELFTRCVKAQGGVAQRACEAEYAEFIDKHFQPPKSRKTA